MSINEKSSDEGMAILNTLEPDFDDTKICSVGACLSHVFRSRQRPAPIVQSLLANLKPQAVKEAYEILLQDYYCKRNDKTTCLVFLKRVAATVWFIQFLLECPSAMQSDAISEQDAHKMALSLLQNLIKTIKTMLQEKNHQNDESDTAISQQEDKEEDDCSMDDINILLNTSTVACFTVGALLKVVNPYVSSLPFLLSPLWKGICNVCVELGSLPVEVAEFTLTALCAYLQEGQAQTMSTLELYCRKRQACPQQQQAFQIKVLTFLVARLSVLLKVYYMSSSSKSHCPTRVKNQDDDTSNPLEDVTRILLQLRGLTLATTTLLKKKYPSSGLTQQDESFVKAYRQLETKVEQCLVNAWLQSSNNSTSSLAELAILERQDLNQFLRLQQSLSSSSRKNKELMTCSFAIGKALVLHRLLVQSMADLQSASKGNLLRQDDVQSLLMMVQELLFSTLPLCSAIVAVDNDSTTLLSKCLNAIVSATVLCHFKSPVENRSQLNRLLVRWLAPPPTVDKELHPLSRELLVSLLHLHTLSVCQAAHDASVQSDSPRSVDLSQSSAADLGANCACIKPLVSLLAKILFDSRTQMSHRRHVASVVIRLLAVPECEDSLLPKDISVLLQQTIAVELQQVIKQGVKAERRKRKRGKSSTVSNQDNTRPLGSYHVDDIQVLSEVLHNVSSYDLSSLDSQLAGLARDLVAVDLSGKNFRYMVGNYSRNAVSLLLSLVSGIMDQVKSAPESFKSKTGMELDVFVSSLVTWLGQQQNRGSNTKRISLRRSYSAVTVACLYVVQSSFEHAGMNVQQLRAIVDIVKEYCGVSCQVLQSDSPPCDPDERRAAVTILVATAPLLAGTTKVIPASCPANILQGIASTYKLLFETNSWPIVARTVTSLVRFASTIPSAHQGILPECIPANSQGLLQCRLQGLVFRDAESHKETESIAVHENCSKVWKRLIPDLKNKDSLFVAGINDTIVEGSYILTMPTANGRSAQVIFAPGAESLDEIRYMLGTEDLHNVKIRKLEQVRLIGNGCRFLSNAVLEE